MKKDKVKYVRLFLAASVVYLIFIIRGLPNNHYLDWSIDFQIGDCLELMLITIPLGYLLLKWFSSKQDYYIDSIWLAFFTSVPFFIYDSFYLGIFKGFGLNFIYEFWFLTIFYFIVWIEFPIIGYLMQKDDPKITKKHFIMLLVAIIGWLLHWWEGSYSNHYLDWALNTKIIRLTNILLILLPLVYFVLRFYSNKDQYLKDAGFLALYLSFIFVLFDFFYLNISKGYGLRYIKDYWFVTLFYPIFWIEIPLIGWVMQRLRTPRTHETE